MRIFSKTQIRIVLVIICASSTFSCYSQIIGNWLNNLGTLADNQAQTTGAVGIGIGPWTAGTKLESWAQIRWCPPVVGSDEAGLFLTLKKCNSNSNLINLNQFQTVPIDFNASSFEPAPLPSFAFTSFLPLGTYPTSSNPNTTYISGVNSGREPLFWARTEETGNGVTTTPGIETQFIVMPNGHTGINVSAPRAALDVRTWGLNTPTAIFGMHALRGFISHPNALSGVQYRFSRHLAIIPFLGAAGYNNNSQKGDLGLIYTDGLGANGENVDGSLLIAPWSVSNSVGGIKLDNLGNVTVFKNLTVQGALAFPGYIDQNLEVRGLVKCTTLLVNQKWWPDYVFKQQYKLRTIEDFSNYIKLNQRLPNFPSAEEVQNNGQDIGELQKLQQQSLEEISLYIIELNARLIEANQKIDKLKNTIDSLESKCQK